MKRVKEIWSKHRHFAVGVVVGFGLVVLHSMITPAQWVEFWKWQDKIGEGFGVLVAALIGFLSIAWVFNENLARGRQADERRRQSLIQILGEEVRSIYQANRECIRAAKAWDEAAKENSIPAFEAVGKLHSDVLQGLILKGHLFREAELGDLALLAPQ